MNKKYIERYEQLIRVLRELPAHEKRRHFDMQEWGEATSCGTTHCAAGFCGIDPWFRKLGFRFDFYAHEDYGYGANPGVYGDMRFGKKESWEALEAFFGPSVRSEDDPHDDEVFQTPKTVNGVITAATKRIAQLRKEK